MYPPISFVSFIPSNLMLSKILDFNKSQDFRYLGKKQGSCSSLPFNKFYDKSKYRSHPYILKCLQDEVAISRGLIHFEFSWGLKLSTDRLADRPGVSVTPSCYHCHLKRLIHVIQRFDLILYIRLCIALIDKN